MRWPKNATRSLKVLATVSGLGIVGSMVAMPFTPILSLAAPWQTYGGNPQHTNISRFTAKPMQRIIWSTTVDEDIASSMSGDAVLIHYAAPLITGANTVVHAVKHTVAGNVNNWKVRGRSGSDGTQKWEFLTDYKAPIIMPSGWTSVYPLSLTLKNSVVAAGGGGTIQFLPNADASSNATTRFTFWGPTSTYTASPSTYAPILINTPITGDSRGNFWFGYYVNNVAALPTALQASVGTGGVVRMNTSGQATFVKCSSLISTATRPSFNAAPVVSNDGSSVYFSISQGSGINPYLVKLKSTTLELQASVALKDPNTGANARCVNESSASPLVGPDGHVFYGVFGSNYRESKGWTLQFNSNLNQFDSNGKRWPVGAFGWDDTASIVPASSVRSYAGTSPYLILTKYNHYHFGTASGDGRNELAVLDPRNDDITNDAQSGIDVMNKVIAVLGVTCDGEFYACTPTTDTSDPSVPVREWCINAAAVDPSTRSAIVNCEDGHCYRWDFDTNTLIEANNLQPPTGEAYTPTVIGPDGTSYAINNGLIHAVGPNPATR